MRHTRNCDHPRRLKPIGNTFVDKEEDDDINSYAVSSETLLRRSHSFAGYVPYAMQGLRESAACQKWAVPTKEAKPRRPVCSDHHGAGYCPVLLGRTNSFGGGRGDVSTGAIKDDRCLSGTAKVDVKCECRPLKPGLVPKQPDLSNSAAVAVPLALIQSAEAEEAAAAPRLQNSVGATQKKITTMIGRNVTKEAAAAQRLSETVGATQKKITTPIEQNLQKEAASAPRLQESVGTTQKKITTMMVRNLPRELTQRMLLEKLDVSGFKGTYDFCYMPRLFTTGQNQGIAFVNFTSPDSAAKFCSAWDRRRELGTCFTTECLSVCPATIQGLKANMAKWNTTRMRRIGNPEFKPVVNLSGTSAGSSCAGNSNTEHVQAPLILTLDLDKMLTGPANEAA